MSLRERVESIMTGEKRPGLLLAPLAVVELIYGFTVSARNFLYDSGIAKVNKTPCAVVSVGNLTVGGTGKTPFTELLVKKLSGRKVAVLSRGYGGGETSVVSDGVILAPAPPVSADEPYMLARNLSGVPVLCNPDRVVGAFDLVEKFGTEVIVLDDGYQHRRIDRDLDILLLPADSLFEDRSLTPLGGLREPIEQIKRADLIVFASSVRIEEKRIKGLEAELRLLGFGDKPVLTAEGAISGFRDIDGATGDLPGGGLYLFAGIARPERFFDSIGALGVDVVGAKNFPDHYQYTERDIHEILEDAITCGASTLLTTEKDAVRLLEYDGSLPLLYARYTLSITRGEENLDQLIRKAVSNS